MKKKKFDKTWIHIGLIIIALIIFFYGMQQGWFKSTTNINYVSNITYQDKLENPDNPPGVTCSLSITPLIVDYGDSFTGIIQDGKNAYCEGYGKMVGTSDWRKLWEGRTDINGRAVYTDDLLVAGTFIFAVMCDTNGNGVLDAQDCVTNQVTATVNPEVDTHTCTDSDGKNKMTPGNVNADGMRYYDNCAGNWAVTEYWCEGNAFKEQFIACDTGYICFETRGGDYCKLIEHIPTYTCTDSDGGINWLERGNCQSSYDNLGYMDGCEGQVATDYYCDDRGICQKATKQCQFPSELCSGGVCQKMPCESGIIPATPDQCTIRECETGTCIYIPAESFLPARCQCG